MAMQERSELALALAGLDETRRRATRGLIARAVELGFGAIQLDAMAADLRPRNLDRSARRDLAALLRRSGVYASGIDLWIPPAHFSSAEHQDRAVAAVCDAMGLVADLGSLDAAMSGVVSIELDPQTPAGILEAIRAASERFGVGVADHRVDARAALDGLAVGIDPAAVLASGEDPADAVLKGADALASARLSDQASTGRVPALIADGRLDGVAYKVALQTANFTSPPVLDLRGVKDPLEQAGEVCRAWRSLGLSGQ